MLTWPLYAEQKMNRVHLVEGLKLVLPLDDRVGKWICERGQVGEAGERVDEFRVRRSCEKKF